MSLVSMLLSLSDVFLGGTRVSYDVPVHSANVRCHVEQSLAVIQRLALALTRIRAVQGTVSCCHTVVFMLYVLCECMYQ